MPTMLGRRRLLNHPSARFLGAMGSDQLSGAFIFDRPFRGVPISPAALFALQVDPDAKPTTFGPAFTGHFRVTADTPKGLAPFQPSAPTTTAVPKIFSSKLPATPEPQSANLPLRKDILENGQPEAMETEAVDANIKSSTPDSKEGILESASTRYNCTTCGVNCTKQRYHSIKVRSYELCANCFFEGRFPSTMNSGDFVRLDNVPTSTAPDTWTDQETLLLLEGIEMFDDNWDLIAEHVGTKNREQCIVKFLRLPIEDPYLAPSGPDATLQHLQTPFSQANNPVMSLIAFLASTVNPGVASAAAQAALKELTASQKAKAAAAEASNGDAMAVDSKPNGSGPSDEEVQKAAAVALGAAAAKAKVLADYEEREMQRLINSAIELQLRKLDVKMKHFEDMESMLEAERRELEKQRQLLFAEKWVLERRRNLI